jgi:polysaccharide biosynthesis/export protein
MKKAFFLLRYICSGFLVLSLLNSCVNIKKLTYFNTITKDSVTTIQPIASHTIIKKNDILQINIFTLDEVVTRMMNPTVSLGSSGMVAGSPAGYLVDESGIIKLPLIGPLKVDGMTKTQLSTAITDELLNRKIAKDPVVTVRISNYEITVLGEVAKPGVQNVPNELITLPEALGQAGDLTIFGKRDKILLIREVNGKRIYKRFNLNDQQAFDPDLYNLQNRDIIYVEPNRAKATSSDNTTFFISISLTIMSFLLTIYGQLIRR